MPARSIIRGLTAALIGLLAAPVYADVNDAAITDKRPPRTLSGYGFFDDIAAMTPAGSLVPYEVSAPLFSDYADKERYIYAPSAAPEPATASEVLEFPIGSALIKTFHYGPDRIETRVLLHQEAGWKGYAYLWREDGSDADLKIAGADLQLDTAYGPIAYRVPNANQCKACHVGADKMMQPIGPKLRNLDVADQLQNMVARSVLAGFTRPETPVPDYRDETISTQLRARAYLDANCAHCHAPGLPADTSGLYLHWEEARPVHLGVLKPPVAAGRGSGGLSHDIVPGQPDASILVYRMHSSDPGVMMPEIGRSIRHDKGLALIRNWIAEMR